MAEPFLGEIRMFGFNFAPEGWAFCNGQLLPISDNTALFSLLGTFYGGNGSTNFQLPNLQSRVAIDQGQGTGLSPYQLGQTGGVENVTLPAHTHPANVSGATATVARPSGATLARPASGDIYAPAPDGTTVLNASTIGSAGNGSGSGANIQPYLVLNFCIALQGIYPSRN